MKRSTISQIAAIHTLLSKQGLKDDKANIVQSFTAGRTTSTKEMSMDEAAALIGHLKSMDPQDKGSDRMRNKILSMAHEMGWTLPVAGDPLPVKPKVDMDHVNAWCKSHGYLKKKLDDYTYTELPKLVSQFEEVYRSFITKKL